MTKKKKTERKQFLFFFYTSIWPVDGDHCQMGFGLWFQAPTDLLPGNAGVFI